MKVAIRLFRNFAVNLTALLVLYFGAALLGAAIPGQPIPRNEQGAVRVGLIAGPIHYDFLLPAKPETRDALDFAHVAGVPLDHPKAEWVLAGWGSRAFYTATGTYLDLDPGTVLTAATGDAGVLRIDVLGPVHEDSALWVTLSAEGFGALLGFIRKSRTGPAIPDTGFTPTDAFFEAGSGFHLFRTCNIWVGEALRHAGRRTGLWTPTTWSLRWSLALHG